MGRAKVLMLMALLGFIIGVAANVVYHAVAPVMLKVFSEVLLAEWVISGIVGSVLTLTAVFLWAYLSEPSAERE